MIRSMRILIIEDEENLARLIEARLKREGFEADIATDGEQGLDMALGCPYDLIILDVMLPSVSGFEILKILRQRKVPSRIILLTARSALEDKLHGLSSGADDYITKPFHLEELAARVRLQLLGHESVLAAGDLELPVRSNKLTCTGTGRSVELSARELALLEYLLQHPGQILSRDQILDRVWGLESAVSENNLEAYLSFLRRKLKAIGSKTAIKAVRGLGYRLEPADE